MTFTIRPYVKTDYGSLKDYMIHEFGINSYQASDEYFRWLYVENPMNDGFWPQLLLDDTDTVVGCIHCMGLTGSFRGDRVNICSLQNLIVAT